MNCPKCKTKIEKNTIKCPSCGIRIGRYCPKCKTYNYITNKSCTNCSEILLLQCPECNSINIPTAKKCRKCGKEFSQQAKEEGLKEAVYDAKYQSLADAKRNILEAINDQNIKIVSVSGANEYGKNYVFKGLMRETSNLGIAWLMGKCTPHTQLTPLGYIQSVLLHLFNVTNFCTSKVELRKESLKFFKQDFPNLSTNEIYDLLNILYPDNIGEYKKIEKQEKETVKIILKIFHTILSKMNSVLLVENIEYIDSFSYEILNILVSDEAFSDKITLIMSFAKEQSGVNCLVTPKLKESHYIDVTVAPFTKEQIDPFFSACKESKISGDLKSKILHYSKNNPVLTEQLINIVYDVKDSDRQIKLFNDLESVMQYRLQLLKEDDYNSYLVLMAVSVLGFKFSPIILNGMCDMEQDLIKQCIDKLVKKNYIVPVSNICYEFKSLNMWNAIINTLKTDKESFRAINQSLYSILSQYDLSTSAILAYIAQNLDFKDEAINLWDRCSYLSAYIGDKGLYIILKKQILAILEKYQPENSQDIKGTIYAEIGKLLEEDNPQLAMNYLPQAVMMCSESEISPKIELLGYLASTSMKMKNYYGAIECIDNTIKLLPDINLLDLAILNSRKLKPLELLGNTGSIVNMVDNDIIPMLEKGLENVIQTKLVSQDDLFEIYIKSHLHLAKALSIQGNKRAFDVLQMIADTCRNNQVKEKEIWLEINIIYAFANTVAGNIIASVKILDEILSQEVVPDNYMSSINLISVLNKYFMNKEDLSYDDLFQATQYADDIEDEFTKNILKLFLGSLIQERTSPKDAIRVYTEQVEFFANKQNALGVLLGWYFIAKAKLIIDGPDATIDIASKALDVAESVSVSNSYFAMVIQKLMGEAYLVKQDYELAKMYIEKAIMIAKNNNLKYYLTKLYILYAKYLQEFSITVGDKKLDYVFSAKEVLNKATILSENLKLTALSSDVKKANRVLVSFCQMNGIVLQSS